MPLITNIAQSQESAGCGNAQHESRNERTVPLNIGRRSEAGLPNLNRFEQLQKTLAPLRYALLNHPIYAEVAEQTARVHANAGCYAV